MFLYWTIMAVLYAIPVVTLFLLIRASDSELMGVNSKQQFSPVWAFSIAVLWPVSLVIMTYQVMAAHRRLKEDAERERENPHDGDSADF